MRYVPKQGNRFVSGGCSVADYGYAKKDGHHMHYDMKQAIESQDADRANRLMSEQMHRLMCVTNYDEFDTDCALPRSHPNHRDRVGCSHSRTRLRCPRSKAPACIALECKYAMGSRPDMAIEV